MCRNMDKSSISMQETLICSMLGIVFGLVSRDFERESSHCSRIFRCDYGLKTGASGAFWKKVSNTKVMKTQLYGRKAARAKCHLRYRRRHEHCALKQRKEKGKGLH